MKFEVEMHEYWMEGMVSKKRFRANGSAIGSFELDACTGAALFRWAITASGNGMVSPSSATRPAKAKSMPDRVFGKFDFSPRFIMKLANNNRSRG